MILLLPSISGYPNQRLWDRGWTVSLFWQCRWFMLIKYQKPVESKETDTILEAEIIE